MDRLELECRRRRQRCVGSHQKLAPKPTADIEGHKPQFSGGNFRVWRLPNDHRLNIWFDGERMSLSPSTCLTWMRGHNGGDVARASCRSNVKLDGACAKPLVEITGRRYRAGAPAPWGGRA